MSPIEIFLLDGSELVEFEATQKGYRLDVYVKVGYLYYKVRVYDVFTLKQDFERELETYGYYAIEPNLILVKEVTNEEIVSTIKKLNEQKYFKEIKPVKKIDTSRLKKIQ